MQMLLRFLCDMSHNVASSYMIESREFLQFKKSIYRNTVSCVRVRELWTDWFSTSADLRQGDNLSPNLFALFINDLAQLKNWGKI